MVSAYPSPNNSHVKQLVYTTGEKKLALQDRIFEEFLVPSSDPNSLSIFRIHLAAFLCGYQSNVA